PPGICVPRCGPMLAECPDGYGCSSIVEACIPEDKIKRTPRETSGCSAAGTQGQSPLWLTLSLLAGVGLRRWRRR
ncbi:MAG TPA: MYXO-CTERM sorting domain-containing protein, partial [Polyangiaceae bacterium]|nr:MYXO-CTERM sorting domain-containing protein [Polyangiaceae bacterium]